MKRCHKLFIRKLFAVVLGDELKVHRILFGSIAGRKIFMSPATSPRMWFGIDEPWIAKICRDRLKSGSVVYDVGAHVGYTTVLFASLMNGSGTIHSFEILPSTAKMLEKTVQANAFENVTVHNVGLGAEECVLELPVGDTAMTSIGSKAGSGERDERCKVVTLSKYVAAQGLAEPDFIKVDIEGAEIDFLHGARSIITSARPLMIIAFHSKALLEKGSEVLARFGYEIFDKRGKVSRSRIQGLQTSFNDSVLCVPQRPVVATQGDR